MSNLIQIEIERDVADAAAGRASQEGLTVAQYISQLLRRTFERAPGEDSVLVYDHVDGSGEFQIEREPEDDEEGYRRRSALHGNLFGRRA